jgi:hypothetical protein
MGYSHISRQLIIFWVKISLPTYQEEFILEHIYKLEDESFISYTTDSFSLCTKGFDTIPPDKMALVNLENNAITLTNFPEEATDMDQVIFLNERMKYDFVRSLLLIGINLMMEKLNRKVRIKDAIDWYTKYRDRSGRPLPELKEVLENIELIIYDGKIKFLNECAFYPMTETIPDLLLYGTSKLSLQVTKEFIAEDRKIINEFYLSFKQIQALMMLFNIYLISNKNTTISALYMWVLLFQQHFGLDMRTDLISTVKSLPQHKLMEDILSREYKITDLGITSLRNLNEDFYYDTIEQEMNQQLNTRFKDMIRKTLLTLSNLPKLNGPACKEHITVKMLIILLIMERFDEFFIEPGGIHVIFTHANNFINPEILYEVIDLNIAQKIFSKYGESIYLEKLKFEDNQEIVNFRCLLIRYLKNWLDREEACKYYEDCLDNLEFKKMLLASVFSPKEEVNSGCPIRKELFKDPRFKLSFFQDDTSFNE